MRLLSTGHGRKSDPADAVSIGIAAWSASALRTVEIDQAIAALRALTARPPVADLVNITMSGSRRTRRWHGPATATAKPQCEAAERPKSGRNQAL